MNIDVPDAAIKAAIEKALTGEDRYGHERSALTNAAKAVLAGMMPQVEAALMTCFRDTLASGALRESINAAIRDGMAEAAREEAGRVAKRRAKVAVEAAEMFGANREDA